VASAIHHQQTTPIDEGPGRSKNCRRAHITLRTAKAPVGGPNGRWPVEKHAAGRRRLCQHDGSVFFFHTVATRGCNSTKNSGSGPRGALRSSSSRHLCPHFAPIPSSFLSISISFHFAIFKADNVNGARPSCTEDALSTISLFFGPLCPRCKIYRMISCLLSHNISTSQTSILSN
jgi:hypothetical protein